MHRMHRIFSGNGWLGILSIRKPAPDHRPSRLPVQEPLVLLILLILCIHVHKNYRSSGAVAVRSKWRRRSSRARLWCGREARAPGWAFSHDRVTPRGQSCRSIPVPAVVEGGPSVFVSIRVHSWFVFKNDRLLLPRALYPPGQAPDWLESVERSRFCVEVESRGRQW